MSNPFAEPRPFPGQDPWVVPFEGELLLVQSTRDDRHLSVLRFPDLAHMHDYDETVIWTPKRWSNHRRQLWAPELHNVDGHWYVYYAASDGENSHHRTYVLESDHPLGPYHELGKVYDAAHDTFSIDTTLLRHDGNLYAVWSGWEGRFDGFPQNLYVAPMSDPWTISGTRSLLSRPAHDWELSVAPINEGPEMLRNPTTGQLFIVYSADASWTAAYKMGLLEFVGDDVTDPTAWRKSEAPLFTGGGHGCFVELGTTIYCVYHHKLTGEPGWGDRVIRYDPVRWDDHGRPVIGREDGESSEMPGVTLGPSLAS